MKRSTSFRGLALAMTVQFVSLSCGGKQSPTRAGKPADGSPLIQTGEVPAGITLRLSNGSVGPGPTDRSKLPPAAKIPDAEAEAILTRLSAIGVKPDDRVGFAFRDKSAPPPRTGKTITKPFQPANPLAGPPPVTSDAGKDLTVVRWSPEGDVPLAPNLQITFSQPMIAVTSQDDAAKTVPATLSPTPPGKWRWLGTKTLIFDPEVRFPQSTTYTVAIAKGTRSATGNVLKDAKSFTFTTPAPVMKDTWPQGGSHKLDVPMFVLFDQKIDPAAVLATIKVKAPNKTYATRLLTKDEIEKHESLKNLVASVTANHEDGRWIAFRANDNFPKDTDVSVTIGPGTPSLEGPNRTKVAQTFGFKTFPPLRVGDCGSKVEWARWFAGHPFHIEFNNPLDVDRIDDAYVAMTPPAPPMKIAANNNYLMIHGATKSETTYTVSISGRVMDVFGQTLGKDVECKFKVEKAYPEFTGPSGLIALDPAAKQPTFDVFTRNYTGLKVRLHQVEPKDWAAYQLYLQNQWNEPKPALPGTKVFDAMVPTASTTDELTETRIPLAPALKKNGLGHVIAIVEPDPWTENYDRPRVVTWVQSTRLALDAAIDADEMYAWVNRLGDGAAVNGAQVTLEPWGIAGKTDGQGTARLKLSDRDVKGPNVVVARLGDDVVFMPNGWYGNESAWMKQTRSDGLVWYVTDDRQMYRPGEKVHLKGWMRVHQGKKGGDITGVTGQVSSVNFEVVDPQNNPIAKGSAPVSTVGGFDAEFTLPKTPNLGNASITFTAVGRMSGSAYHGFQIQEFRRPEFEVSAQASQGPHLIGGNADVTVQASYFAGGGLPGAPVEWHVTANETTFTPPNRDDFTFGVWTPWWGWSRRWWDDGGDDKPSQDWNHSGETDATGAHVLHFDFVSANPAVPMSVSANAAVIDVNRQSWAAKANLLVHPSSVYVGVRTERQFVEKGQPIELEAIAVDLDGKAVVGTALDIKTVRLAWEFEKGTYVEKELDPQSCAPRSAADAVKCEFTTAEGGQYKITAMAVDARGRPNKSELTVWVSGGDTPPSRDVEQEVVQLIPNAKEYRAGDTAELLVQAPFYPAEGVLSVRRSGVVSNSRFSMSGPTYLAKVPITDAYTPNIYVQVDLVGATVRADGDGKPDPSLPKRPAYATGVINLPVPPKQRTLKVEVAPREAKLAPGDQAFFDVTVRDASGKPVSGSEVALIVIDEAILSLTGYTHPNPIDAFYGTRGADAQDHHLRQLVKLPKPEPSQLVAKEGVAVSASSLVMPSPPPPPAAIRMAAAEMDADGVMDAADVDVGPAAAIAVRSNFEPLAVWSPQLKTDSNGRATLDVKMPDNLTRYRVVAIAAQGERNFGKGESAITARMPLMVRPSPPRFLNFGDTFELPVVLQNQTDQSMNVKVAVRGTNADLTDGLGRSITVPPNDRVEVRFPAAAEMAGTARFQLAATSGTYSDAAEVALPVWTPATTEAFATYGEIDSGAIKQPIALPGKVVTEFGGLEVETSSTQLQALTDAFLYLVSYPFECSEQLASRIAGVASLRDVLTAFKASGLPSTAALEASVSADLQRLATLQNYDGGFPFWRRGDESWPYLTVHVTNAMVRAKGKGYVVSERTLSNALSYLASIDERYPAHYSVEVRRSITSYALYTRMLASRGNPDLGAEILAGAKKLMKDAGGVEKLSMEANGWLLGVFAKSPAATAERKALLRHFDNKVSETAGAANFTTSYADGAYLLLHSDRRVDAIVLESLIAEKRDSDLIPKLVRGLLGHQKAGRWNNTQENVFVLFALDRYFREFEKLTPNFVARVWLGDGYAGDHPFKGRQTDRHNLVIPMRVVADKAATKPADLVIQKDGTGRLYYRIGMTYAPADLKLAAADYGFTVLRRYEPIDDPADVVRQPDGTWKIKAGARVRVRLSMLAENRRYHVALVDPLPAGLEAMNPALAVTGEVPQDPAAMSGANRWSWYGTWFEHQNLRDERVEAFTSLLWEGAHEYTYVARATTPGHFVVPPTKAEEMYSPETFGRSASDRVVIE